MFYHLLLQAPISIVDYLPLIAGVVLLIILFRSGVKIAGGNEFITL